MSQRDQDRREEPWDELSALPTSPLPGDEQETEAEGPGLPRSQRSVPAGPEAASIADPDAATATGEPGARGPVREMPERIGPYRILSVLGEGGMGAVYLARQSEPVERLVAIKLIRASLTSPAAVARFAAERQALARLSHPAIAQMLEAGTTDDGFPYFVMEQVPGRTLTRYCDLERLGVRERLEILIGVCRGVEHAHRKGILHRDLKPSNVLVTEVDGEPAVKIIDFGIAKAMDQPLTDATLLTRFGIGTPAYMSPEAFEITGTGADVDTRADVYALGVMLYELLAGVPPFDTRGLSMAEVLRTVTQEVPELPSRRFAALDEGVQERLAEARGSDRQSLARRLGGDLDWIVAKAIEKDRDRRYGSATELAADLRRHLDLEPVLARAPSLGYRTGRFVRRHRLPVAAATLALAALVAGVLGTTWGMLRASREAERANLEAAKARAALLDAEEVTDFLVELFEVSDPREAGGDSTTARELLDRGAARLEEQLAEQPLRQARLMHTIGTIYNQLQVHREARELVAKALELRREALSESHEDVADSLHRLAVISRELADYEAARQAAAEALEIRRAARGDGHPSVGESERELGVSLYLAGRLEEAEPHVRRALEIAERGEDPEARAAAVEAMGNLLKASGRCDRALPYLERSLAIRERRLGPLDPRLAYALNNTGSCLGEAGRYAEAKEHFERALAIQERVLGPEAVAVAAGRANLGIVYRQLGELDAAEAAFVAARDALLASLGPDHPMTANPMAELGVLLWRTGRLAEAETQLRRALEVWQRKLGADHLLTAWAHWGLAGVLRDAGRPAESEAHYRRALEIRRRELPSEHPELRETLRDYAQLLHGLGRDDEARALTAAAESEA